MERADFYVYAHRRNDTGAIFYIGKGRGRRLNCRHGRSQMWTRVAAKHGYVAEIIAGQLTESEAFAEERRLIATHRPPCNFTDGGEGISGFRHSESTRLALSAAHKGRKQSPEAIAARMEKLRGKKRSAEVMARWVNPMKGRRHTAEVRAKMSADRMGRRNPQSSIDRVAAFHRGAKRPPEARARMSEAQPKRPVVCVCTGERFISITKAAEWVRASGRETASKTGIWMCLKGKTKTAYGHRWAYAE